MAALVETMFYTSNEENNRFVPWHGLGTAVEEAPTSADALRLAGLDWEVIQRPVMYDASTPNNFEYREVENYKANVRSSDNSVLGIVTDRYRIVQNKEAFDFTDSLIGNGVRYETAGSLRGGRTVWLLAKMPSSTILGDQVDPYICFTNSHDGTGAIKVAMTPIRVVCNNTLNMALDRASRCWSTKHIGNIQGKLSEARKTLELANTYMDGLSVEADHLANSKITDDEIQNILKELFPVDEDATDRQKKNIEKAKEEIMVCYLAPDIQKFLGTKYGFVNAMSDWCTHAAPNRLTDTYRENNWGRVMNGHPIFDKAYSLVTKD